MRDELATYDTVRSVDDNNHFFVRWVFLKMRRSVYCTLLSALYPLPVCWFACCSDLAHRDGYGRCSDHISWVLVECSICRYEMKLKDFQSDSLGLSTRHWWHIHPLSDRDFLSLPWSLHRWFLLKLSDTHRFDHVPEDCFRWYTGFVPFRLIGWILLNRRSSAPMRSMSSPFLVRVVHPPHILHDAMVTIPHRLAIHPFDGLPVQGEQETVLMLCCNLIPPLHFQWEVAESETVNIAIALSVNVKFILESIVMIRKLSWYYWMAFRWPHASRRCFRIDANLALVSVKWYVPRHCICRLVVHVLGMFSVAEYLSIVMMIILCQSPESFCVEMCDRVLTSEHSILRLRFIYVHYRNSRHSLRLLILCQVMWNCKVVPRRQLAGLEKRSRFLG